MRAEPSHEPAPSVPEVRKSLETERIEACPLCGSTATVSWRTKCRDWQRPYADDMFEFDRCMRCDARFLKTRPLRSELEEVYFGGYGPHHAPPTETDSLASSPLTRIGSTSLRALGSAFTLLPRRSLSRALDGIYALEAAGDTLLDYGCGAPTFLDGAKRRGWNTVGVDVAADVVEAVRAQGHAAFLEGEDFEAGVGERSVACVRMNHVIEHLYEPTRVLKQIRAKLRPGARLHLATPNPVGAGSWLFRSRWMGLDCPRHAVLFPPNVLERLLEGCGFHVLGMVHEAAPKDLARSWGIVRWARGRMAAEQIGALATDPAYLSLYAPVAAATALVSVGDRYHVLASA